MGGVDKGLQNFNGTPLTLHTLMRLQMQDAATLSELMVVANRNLSAYESFGVQVWPDSTDGFAGPLAGFLTGLERCETDLLLTVPCDSPLFPLNLTQRLLDDLIAEDAEIAVAAAKEEDGSVRAQPVFCLMRVSLLESLVKFMQTGGRKIDAWTAQHKTVLVPFDTDDVDPRAFFNANTLEELHRLEQSK
jgi:molybdopterin-guanine dinucleotide biosynthesis protein A